MVIRGSVNCVQGRARLEILTALDRPLLLRLQAAGNRYAWAVLLGADARNVRLHMGQREIQIDRSVLLAHWNGEYAALWVGQGALQMCIRDSSSANEGLLLVSRAATCLRQLSSALPCDLATATV